MNIVNPISLVYISSEGNFRDKKNVIQRKHKLHDDTIDESKYIVDEMTVADELNKMLKN